MRPLTFAALAALALSSACGTSDVHPDLITPSWAAQAVDQTVPDVAERAVRSVVHIAATQAAQPGPGLPVVPFGFGSPRPDPRQGGIGSGVIVDAGGLILTNNHVVEGADTLMVTLHDGRKFEALVRGTDPATDLAVLQLRGKVPGDLQPLALGDSERLRLGEPVLAIGNPFGLQGTVTLGIVSAIGRADIGLAAYENFIQTDAAINPGNSGGALVNLRGEVVGINTAIESFSGGSQGVGFSIPSNMAQEIMARLVSDGRVVRGYLGVGIQDIEVGAAKVLGLKTSGGALVNHVEPGTPSATAGIRVGDVITAVDGQPVADASALRRTIAMKGATADVAVDVVRDGAPLSVNAHLTALPGTEGVKTLELEKANGEHVVGLRMRELDAREKGQSGLSGVLITEVLPGSQAARAGLAPGDVVVEANRRPVEKAADLQQAVRSGEGVLLLIQRGDVSRFVFLDAEGR